MLKQDLVNLKSMLSHFPSEIYLQLQNYKHMYTEHIIGYIVQNYHNLPHLVFSKQVYYSELSSRGEGGCG